MGADEDLQCLYKAIEAVTRDLITAGYDAGVLYKNKKKDDRDGILASNREKSWDAMTGFHDWFHMSDVSMTRIAP